jgi:chromosome segregation ATPase
MKLRFSTIALALVAQTALLSAPSIWAQNAEAQANSATTQEKPSGAHRALAWSQDRLAQLDADITALENDAGRLRGETRTKAEATLADLRKQRDAYRRRAQDAAAHEKNWSDAQVAEERQALDNAWATFQTTRDEYLDESAATIATRRAVLEAELEAQEKALAGLRADAAKLSADQRVAIDARIAALNADVDKAKARVSKTSGDVWETTKKSYGEAQRHFFETYASIRQSIDEAVK